MTADNVKVTIGYILGAAAFIYVLYAAHSLGNTPSASTTNILWCIAGGTFGWIAGILLTPHKKEMKDFAKIGGALMTFISGFVLAKFEPLLDSALENGTDSGFVSVTLLFAVSFSLGALFVFVGRKYL